LPLIIVEAQMVAKFMACGVLGKMQASGFGASESACSSNLTDADQDLVMELAFL